MEKRNKLCEAAAINVADILRKKSPFQKTRVAIIPGTGWSKAIQQVLKVEESINLDRLPGFHYLEDFEAVSGHELTVRFGSILGIPTMVVGRIHNYQQSANPKVPAFATRLMIRLQNEMIMQLQPDLFIPTAGVGALPQQDETRTPRTGDVAVINDFTTLYAPLLPLFDGDGFNPPQFRVSPIAVGLATQCTLPPPHVVHTGKHVMVPGPLIESMNDKQLLGAQGNLCIGMSLLDSVAVATLYENGTHVLPLGLITNGYQEKHDHESVSDVGTSAAGYLANYLYELFSKVAQMGV